MQQTLGRTVVHLVEPQHLFVPALLDVFEEAGLFVDDVASSINPRSLLDMQPEIVFIDTDFIDEPLENVRLVHVLCPAARVIAYSSARSDAIARAFKAAGAHVVLDKSASRDLIVTGLRAVELQRRHS